MSEIIEVSREWLALREAEDARARSRKLARAAARRLAAGPIVIHDLGSGTGSMMRWLAPLLPGPQTWVLHDWNSELVEHATRGGAPRDRDGQPVSVRTRTGELSLLEPGALDGASLVTASALLDVLTSDELRGVVDACVSVGCPVLLSLSVTGEVRLDPPDPLDDAIAAAFDRHQQRLVDGRRLLGPTGVAVAEDLFHERGWSVRTATTPWRLGGHDPLLLEQWLDGRLEAAIEQRPGLALDDYRGRRSDELRRGALSAVVAHTDLLAWP